MGKLGPMPDLDGQNDPGAPKAVGLITWNLLVSIALPGPITLLRFSTEV